MAVYPAWVDILTVEFSLPANYGKIRIYTGGDVLAVQTAISDGRRLECGRRLFRPNINLANNQSITLRSDGTTAVNAE